MAGDGQPAPATPESPSPKPPLPGRARLRPMATLGDVAALAGVSISAVSRVLSDAPSARVSEATRERIVQAAKDLHYRPNFAGRALKSARTQVVDIVLHCLRVVLKSDNVLKHQDYIVEA